MCSYNRINGVPSCENPQTLGILKGWGLRGFVEPDAALAVRDTAAGANAGVDNFQIGNPAALRAAVADGKIPQARIDDAARRILIGMIGVGLLDAPAPVAKPVASTPAHRALATEISAEATVLLQNRGGVLPLDAERPLGRRDRPRRRAGHPDRGGRLAGGEAGPGRDSAGGHPGARAAGSRGHLRGGDARRRAAPDRARERADAAVGLGPRPARHVLLGLGADLLPARR